VLAWLSIRQTTVAQAATQAHRHVGQPNILESSRMLARRLIPMPLMTLLV